MRLRDLNPFWRQLPVYSPVTFGSILAGLGGAGGSGDPLPRLRDLLAREYGTSDLLLLDSGTSALRLAIEGSLAETSSDIVALPAYCCFDVATAAVGANARVALYDVTPETLGPDFDSLRRALESGARTVVVAHLYGIPVDLDASRELADGYGAVLIEDAAQGAGGSWHGRQLGSWGDLGILSFGRGKGRTGGGGGALLANTTRGASILAGLREVPSGGGGWSRIAKLTAQWAFGRPSLYGIPASLPFLGLGETTYKEPWEPTGMSAGPAAALLVNWEPSKREEEGRRQYASDSSVRNSGEDATGSSPGRPPTLAAVESGGFLRLPRLTEAAVARSERRDDGIMRGYPNVLVELAPVRERLLTEEPLPGADTLVRRLQTGPSHRWERQESGR